MSRRKPVWLICTLTIIMVAAGIFGLVVRRPSPEFNPVEMVIIYWPYLLGALATGGIIGLIWTRSPFQAFMLSLGSAFVFCGAWFYLNSHLSQDAPKDLKFYVVEKKKEFVEKGFNSGGYWDTVLYTGTRDGQQYRFSTHASHISDQEWEQAKAGNHRSYILVRQHPGAFGMPWWEILGLQSS